MSTVGILGWPDIRPVSVFIYALTDPDGAVRYVGKSANPRKRLSSHRHHTASAPVRAWISELRKLDEFPRMKILKEIPPGEDSAPWELHFILEHRKQSDLLNCKFAVEREAERDAQRGAA